MSMKHTKIMRLTHGTKSQTEYLHAFNNLSRYAIEFVDTDVKNIASFKRVLSPKLMKTLANSKCATFNEFVSDALTQEKNNIYSASKSRKRADEAGVSQPKAPTTARPQFHPPAPKYRPPQKKVYTSQNQKVYRMAFSIAPTFHLAVCHAGTATRLAIGQGIAPIPRRTTTRSRVIQMDVRDMCTIPP